MSKKSLSVLWLLTGLLALGLLGLTIGLVIKASTLTEPGVPGQVIDSNSAVVLLHAEPGRTAAVITMLESLTAVTVVDSQRVDDVLWYEVVTNAGQGWVLARYIAVEAQ
jgi:hypothetical protein